MQDSSQGNIQKYIKQGFRPSQIEKCRKAFTNFDLNGDGVIQIDELRQALQDMGHKPTEEELYHMMNEGEEKGKCQISFDNFMSIILKHKLWAERNMREDIVNTFVALGGKFDENLGEVGTIDLNEVKRIIYKEFKMEIDLTKLINEYDANGDSKIQFNEFMDLMSS